MIQGINVKESNGEILVGIHREEFIAGLRGVDSKNGWVNLILSPLKEPIGKGYTHSIRVQKQKKP